MDQKDITLQGRRASSDLGWSLGRKILVVEESSKMQEEVACTFLARKFRVKFVLKLFRGAIVVAREFEELLLRSVTYMVIVISKHN